MAKRNAPAETKKAEGKVVKSESKVVMLETVLHNGILFAKDARVTLSPDVFSLFVSKGQAAAVEVADSDVKSDSDSQSQEADKQAGDATESTVPEKAPEADATAGASDAGGADANKEAEKSPSNS